MRHYCEHWVACKLNISTYSSHTLPGHSVQSNASMDAMQSTTGSCAVS